MENSSDTILKVDHLYKSFKDFTLSDISFSLNQGYILGIIGRNGAGKTTLINLILGNIAPSQGQIKVGDFVESSHLAAAKNEMGFIVEPAPFYAKLTLEENAKLLGNYYTDWNSKLFYKLLTEFELYVDSHYDELSKGMKTRFQLAFALAHNPKLLIMDEPTGGLEPVFRREFFYRIQGEVKDRMMSVIISTHLTSELDKVADYIMLIDKGKQVFYMDKEMLLESYPLIQGKSSQLALLPQNLCRNIRECRGAFTTMISEPSYLNEHPKLRKQLNCNRPTIEDVMFYLSESELHTEKEENQFITIIK